MNCESEILQKKYICETNTVNDMKLMILEKIRVCNSHMFLQPTRSECIFSFIFFADLSYVGFAPLGDFVNILGDSKKVDFGRHFWVQIDLF